MTGSYQKKTREIKHSISRRARLRRNYLKMLGEDPKQWAAEQRAKRVESQTKDTETEGDGEPKEPEKKLTKKQLASKRRAEKYHKQKAKEEELQRKKERRIVHKDVMKSTTRKGQPKLGSQVGVLLDKIKQRQL